MWGLPFRSLPAGIQVVLSNFMRQPPKITEFAHYPVIAGTSLLAIAVTVAMWLKVDISPLLVDAVIRRGELWRLVTTVLPHSGILHLAFNVYWVWVFGTLLEKIYGHFKTAALILLFAIGSSAWEFGLLVGGIGLSGVGYGLFGLLWMLSRRDPRFEGAADAQTVRLFIAWFFFCIVTTALHFLPVANIAHGTGALLGILVGLAITMPDNRALAATGTAAVFLIGLCGATLARPRINLSDRGGYEEGKWGYDALIANKNAEAIRWFRDAAAYQPKTPIYWYDLGIAYARAGNMNAAIASYRRAADLGDPHAQYVLATLYEVGSKEVSKDSSQAVYWYRKLAQQKDPESLNNVAWAYATSSDPAIRNPEAALQCARKATDLDKNNPNPNHLDTLAEALYANGRSAEAVKVEQQAIALASAQSRKSFEERMEKYQLAVKNRVKSAGEWSPSPE
jgi:membrane associated rhomboid family serine protease